MSFKTLLFFLCFVFIPPQVQSPVQSSAFASGEEGGGLLWNLYQSFLEFAVVPFPFLLSPILVKSLLKVHFTN